MLIKGRESGAHALTLLIGGQCIVELLKARMLNSGKNILPAVGPENTVFDALNFIIRE